MRIKKKYLMWGGGAIVVLLAAFFAYPIIFPPAYYPDIQTPKVPLGNAEAQVTIIEFSDLQCPFCGQAWPIVKQIAEEYGDDVAIYHYHYPLGTACNSAISRNTHPDACKAAEASECAADQGKFWEFVELAFLNQNKLDVGSLKTYARNLGLDSASFDACLDSGAKKKYVVEDVSLGIQAGVQGTPTFFINQQRLQSWKLEDFRAAVEAAIASSEAA
jgi:protein-disulfide isomerase